MAPELLERALYHILYTPYTRYHVVCYTTPHHTTLYSTLLYSTLLYSTLLYSTPLYSQTILYSILLDSILLYFTLLDSTRPYYKKTQLSLFQKAPVSCRKASRPSAQSRPGSSSKRESILIRLQNLDGRDVYSTWTPKACKRMAFEAVFGDFWLLFYILLGSR